MNPYKVLGVSPTASLDECKKAYRRLCRKHHPDVGGDEKVFSEIAKAYNMIVSGKYDVSKFVIKHKHLRHKSLFTLYVCN